MKDWNPYVEARREWNDRYLDLVQARRWWQIAAVAELALAGVLGGGLVALGLQHKTVPYVVEVDALGAAIAVKPVEAAGRPTDERIVRYQLAALIRGTRGVMTDRVAMKRGLRAAPEWRNVDSGRYSKLLPGRRGRRWNYQPEPHRCLRPGPGPGQQDPECDRRSGAPGQILGKRPGGHHGARRCHRVRAHRGPAPCGLGGELHPDRCGRPVSRLRW